MRVTVKLEGFAAMEGQLARLKASTGKAVLRRALRDAAQPMADLMSANAARNTGTLAESAAVSTKLSKRQARLHRRMFRDNRASVEMHVGFGPLAQATQMEFGNYKDTPQPAARPAWDADKYPLLDRLKRDLWAQIEKAIARASRAGRLIG
jgi:hypothetical protein